MIWVKVKPLLKKRVLLLCKAGSKKATFFFLIFLCSSGSLAYPADTSFYTLSPKWEKANSSGIKKKDALDQGFSSALLRSVPPRVESGPPSAPTINRTLEVLATTEKTIRLELNQSLIVRLKEPVVKFVATEDNRVTIETLAPEALGISGVGIGETFLHIWTASGRSTFQILVIPQKYVPSVEQTRQFEAVEKSRPFRIGYYATQDASYTGEKYRVAQRSNVNFYQTTSLEGDTPYGALSSHVSQQKDRDKFLLTDAQVYLQDAKIGRLTNFDIAGGDSQVSSGLMAFSGGRIRGVALRHWDDEDKLTVSGFYGREQSGIIGTLSPGIVSKRTSNSYLRGAVADYKLNENAKFKTGYFVASGTDRAADLNNRGMGTRADIKMGHFLFSPEIGYDSRHFGNRHTVIFDTGKLRVRDEFRDINKHFQSLIGASAGQGELGNLLEVTADPFESLTLSGSLDIFRDRLIPNPEKPDEYNTHTIRTRLFSLANIECDPRLPDH